MLRDLKRAIQTYDEEYDTFPVLVTDSSGTDLLIRSRGVILQVLEGIDSAALNHRTIKFIELPMVRNQKFGLWKDGSEWVLSDSWGEPYYIVFDTSKDDKIANPEFGANQTDPTYAEKCKLNPPPTLPAEVIIYSSGPDRDPKTWHDNTCSWRQ